MAFQGHLLLNKVTRGQRQLNNYEKMMTSTSQDLFQVLTISKDWHNLWSQFWQPSEQPSLHGQASKYILVHWNSFNSFIAAPEPWSTYNWSMLYFLYCNHSNMLYSRFHTLKYNQIVQFRIYFRTFLQVPNLWIFKYSIYIDFRFNHCTSTHGHWAENERIKVGTIFIF